MSEEKSNEKNKQAFLKTLEQMLSVYVKPEVDRRQKSGKIAKPYIKDVFDFKLSDKFLKEIGAKWQSSSATLHTVMIQGRETTPASL